MRPLDRTRLAGKYPGKWVALKADRETVIASGRTVQQALDGARKKGYDQPVITRMPLELLYRHSYMPIIPVTLVRGDAAS